MGLFDLFKRKKNNSTGETRHVSSSSSNMSKGKAYLLLFSANWCGPSKAFVKALKESGFYSYSYLDVDEQGNDKLALQYKVTNIPTTILVDLRGNVIKKWVGYDDEDPGQQGFINYVRQSGYELIDYKTKRPFSEHEAQDDTPRPLDAPLTQRDMAILMQEGYREKMLAFASDGGTKDETKIKLEVLLNKRPKTDAMLAVEEQIRNFFRTVFSNTGQQAVSNSGGGILSKLAVATDLLRVSQLIEEDDYEGAENIKTMIRIANSYGVSFHLIKDEEYQRALSKYRDGIDC